MKKKSLLINCLSAAFLGASLLTASCSSGSGNGSTNSSSNPPVIGDPGGALTDVLALTGGDLETMAVSYITKGVTNMLGGGTWTQSATQIANAKLINKIDGQLTNIQSTIDFQSQQLQALSNDLNDYTLGNSAYNLLTAQAQVASTTTGLLSLAYLALDQENYKAFESSVLMRSESPVSNIAMNKLTKYLKNNESGIQTVALLNSFGDIDALANDIACTESSNINYGTNIPTTSCGMINYLNSTIVTFTTANSKGATSGNNFIYSMYQYFKWLNIVYLRDISVLARVYALDEIRLYLYFNDTSLNIATPTGISLNNYNDAESQLTANYNNQVSNITNLFKQTQQTVFNIYLAAMSSPSITANCNLSENGINNLAESQFTSVASNASSLNGNALSWDGQYLTTTCANSHFESITTTTDITDMCFMINSTYYLSASDGYIRCGGGNYIGSNISNASIPLFGQTYYGTSIWAAPSYPYENAGTMYAGTTDPMALYTKAQPASITVAFNSVTYPFVAGWSPINGGINMNGGVVNNSATTNSAPANTSSWTFYPTSINIQATADDPCPGGNCTWYPNMTTNTKGWIYVDDGVHAFMIGLISMWHATSGQAKFPNANAVYVQCIPNDINCVSGVWENKSIDPTDVNTSTSSDYQGLLFSNGDVVALTQSYGAQGAYNHDVTTNNYTLYQWYSGACAGGMINYSPANNSANPIPWGGNNLSGIIPASSWTSMVNAINAWGAPGHLATTVPFSNIVSRKSVNTCNY
ncbi:MAG TPA: hypothetical protein PLP75_06145 [Burkholderiales bacterium]|nr:hypothetical protein [Burkholderiales bacterium]